MSPETRRARVILGATCYLDAEGAIRVAVEIARQIGADLHGVLVADEAIMAAASTPRARCIGFGGAQVIEVTAARMEAAFRADARRFEQQLQRAAQAASLATAFRQMQGRLATALDQGAGTGDVLIYGFSRDPGSTDCVALVVGAAPPAPRFAALAAQLSQKTGKPLLIFAPPGIGGPDVITCDSPEALLARLERHRPAAVIGAAPRADLPLVARLLDAARCPLILPATSPEGDS
ncbi:hypothetical protein BXY70_3607 [Roseovarius halotolerans]|uniref:Universal stress protein family protein n=1 Tax=Roseovarius halotolerans TaxID=505353 RepID=A0A1X6ZL97_9RHOB|nr:hypothetical protein [Roseovarius halotolerans]RKT28247.1 hypothetical protein BXY70_3607 [Roseovarius halotolerans]SLN55182.1 hypothetical protein ROH8110_02993 [Roseovarius halotolerans]